MMTNEEKFEHWLDRAQYDLDTADALFVSGRWFYVVFMCQQAIEKLVKGLYVLYVSDDVPRIHNIKTLIKRFEDTLPVRVPADKYTLFDTLTGFYMNGRYPETISSVGAQVQESAAAPILSQTKEAFLWLLTLKP
jgi:HEPN domain-containing protein